MATTSWVMPKPQIGDVVLFSSDCMYFSNPTVGWVIQEPGDSTISILAFTATGFLQRNSVHHKDDPALKGDHGWHELGVWDFAPATRAMMELREMVEQEPEPPKVTSGRQAAAK